MKKISETTYSNSVKKSKSANAKKKYGYNNKVVKQPTKNLLRKISAKLQHSTVSHMDACQFKGYFQFNRREVNFVQLDVQYVQ